MVHVEKRRRSGWWVCIANGRRGLVPSNYLEPEPDERKQATEKPRLQLFQ